ncbi:hypothetical protein QR680_003915 [Steinernema hermaphroditum]|uniref:Uncharacterized protein n=1 Tax=Steinernema hermaphroditum TaxID=289476 RepID=A0AA39HN41_9BILA|nr:hypothetical protein QR680_003915 [Steinernema hermaphroditum]
MDDLPHGFIDDVLSLQPEKNYYVFSQLSGLFGAVAQIWAENWFYCQVRLCYNNSTKKISYRINKSKGYGAPLATNIDIRGAELRYCKKIELHIVSNEAASKTATSKQFSAFLDDLKRFSFELIISETISYDTSAILYHIPKDIEFIRIDTVGVFNQELDDIVERSLPRGKLDYLSCDEYWVRKSARTRVNAFIGYSIRIMACFGLSESNCKCVKELLWQWLSAPQIFKKNKAFWGRHALNTLSPALFKRMDGAVDDEIKALSFASGFRNDRQAFFEMRHPKRGFADRRTIVAFFSDERMDDKTFEQCVEHGSRWYNVLFL